MYKMWVEGFDESQFNVEDLASIRHELYLGAYNTTWLRTDFDQAVRDITEEFRTEAAYRYHVNYMGYLEIHYIEYVPKPEQILRPDDYFIFMEEKHDPV